MSKLLLTETRVREISRRLDSIYPRTNLSNRTDPLEEAIFIILTSQTDEDKYLETWNSFITKFPLMRLAASAEVNEIAQAIHSGGLGQWKAQRIKKLLSQIWSRFGEYSLRSLEGLNEQELEKELVDLDGIGIKSAKCIMMYSFNRQVFPIDTHCIRILRRLGARMPIDSPRTRPYAKKIEEQIPREVRHQLHVNLIQHGRSVCTTHPKCESCVLIDLCNYYGKQVQRKFRRSNGENL